MPVSDAYLQDLQIEDLFYDQIEEDYDLYAEELEPLLADLDALIDEVLEDA